MKREVSILFDILENRGVKDVVCSPGSRNAPLLLDVASREGFSKHIVVDERMAAFIALGISMVSRTPSVLICTSGSAVLNYAPALAEAYYQGVPLIVVSADRPLEWIDQDDSQTIRQYGILSSITKGSYDITADRDSKDYAWYTNRLVNEAYLKAVTEKPGPVHINVRLAPPLDERVNSERNQRIVRAIEPHQKLERKTLDELVEQAATLKTMIVAGAMKPDSRLQKAVLKLMRLPNVCIMAETISNLHLPSSEFMVDSVLARLTDKEKESLRPELLISIGGSLVSNMLKKYLRDYSPQEHWYVGNPDNLIDCFKSLTTKIELPAPDFMAQFASRITTRNHYNPISSVYRESWRKTREEATDKNESYFNSIGWCDLTAFRAILSTMPEDINLFLSNGTPIRYSQIIPYKMPHATYCNRGVAGIEGSVATLIGGSLKYSRLSLLITGDMSLSYDLSSLGSPLVNGRMRVIVMRNGGGAIFRHIESTRRLQEREQYFCADSPMPLKAYALASNWEYHEASNLEELQECISTFYDDSSAPKLLCVNLKEVDGSINLRKFLENKI